MLLANAAARIPAPQVQEALTQGAQLLMSRGERVTQAEAALVDRIAETASATYWCQYWYDQGEVLKATLDLFLKVATLLEGFTGWCADTMKDAVTEGTQEIIDNSLSDQYTPDQQAVIQESEQDCLVAIREIE
ncbi:MAG: hypothetical protein MUE60_08570, partial [Candidatus Eisenbacteria bacterium]|nr:hypothetical protein [Candidatus Eisenbacteria bacterium]